jgi:hypothetical protein
LRLRLLCARFGHDLLDFVGGAREFCGEQLVAVLGDQDVVFDAHSDIFFGDVDAGLVSDYHSGLKRAAIVHIVNVEAQVMPHAVKEVAAERVAVQVVAVRVDVVVSGLMGPMSMAPGLIAASAAFCAPKTIS